MSAILSYCGTYRYRLEREIGMEGPVFAFFGINPSTADATTDDATVRKWTGFTKAWGGSRFIVGNVFAYRATNVRELAEVVDPFGPCNLGHLTRITAEADVLVPCWGASAKLPKALRHHLGKTLALLHASPKPVRCFGLTGEGDPLHPLFLPYTTALVPLENSNAV